MGFIHKVTRFARKRVCTAVNERNAFRAPVKDLKTRMHRNAYLISVEDASSERGTFPRPRFPFREPTPNVVFFLSFFSLFFSPQRIDFSALVVSRGKREFRLISKKDNHADRISANTSARVLDLAFQSALTLQAWAELLRFRCCSVALLFLYISERAHTRFCWRTTYGPNGSTVPSSTNASMNRGRSRVIF